MRKNRVLRRVTCSATAVALLLLMIAPGARAADVPLRSLDVVRGKAVVLGGGDGELKLRPGGATRATVREAAAHQLAVRAHRGRCATAPVLVVRVGGRRVLRTAVRSRRARTFTAPLALAGGDHRVDVVAARRPARARCAADLRVETVELRVRPRRVSIGTAVNSAALGDPGYRDTLVREFDAITPENELKMSSIAPTADGLTFAHADRLVDSAAAHGQQVRGHALIWGLQLPGWLTSGNLTGEELTGVLRSHVATVVSRYRGRIPEWDVVNEPLAHDGTLAGNVWSLGMGPGYVELALRTAREADPAARLFINEIGTELDDRKFDGLLTMARDLRARGVPLDGIGLQNHAHVDRFPSRARLAERMRRIAALGLEVQITEMDVSALFATRTPPGQIAERQAEAYAAAAQACNEVPACTRFTVWGVADRFSWMGPFARPLLFDDAFAPKPALAAVRAAFASRR